MRCLFPQEHAPGAEAEVDFDEVYVVLNEVKTKRHMFIFRLSHSGRAIHRIYPTQAQEAFLEGHIEAFNVLGGIPTKHIRYHNLTSAVTAVVLGQGRQRQENDRSVLFRSFYGFIPSIASLAAEGPMKRAGLRVRRAGSGATDSRPCQWLSPWTSSTTASRMGSPERSPADQ